MCRFRIRVTLSCIQTFDISRLDVLPFDSKMVRCEVCDLVDCIPSPAPPKILSHGAIASDFHVHCCIIARRLSLPRNLVNCRRTASIAPWTDPTTYHHAAKGLLPWSFRLPCRIATTVSEPTGPGAAPE